MGFFLFTLVNGTYFIRPSEVFGIEELTNTFFVLILACLCVSVTAVLNFLFAKPLDNQPVMICILGILLFVPLPFLFSGDLNGAYRAGLMFFKIVIYYLLLVSVVNTGPRLKSFVGWILVFSTILAIVSVLNMHGVVNLEKVQILSDRRIDPMTGEPQGGERLIGWGIFADPNEMCVLLAALLPLAIYFLVDQKAGVMKIVWLASVLVFTYAIFMTRSRGGFLALIAGLSVLGFRIVGGQKTAILAFFGMLLMVFVGGGRQTEISFTTNTAQSRIELWSDWMMTFRSNPFVGAGVSLDSEEGTEVSPFAGEHLAHNSYLQAFADMGFPGGVCFLGAFCLSLWTIRSLGASDAVLVDPDQHRLQPFLLGAVTAYAVGLISLTLTYAVTTYLVIGLATAFVRVNVTQPPLPPLRFDAKYVGVGAYWAWYSS